MVLTLAVGPNASLLCKTSCERTASATADTECPHGRGTVSTTAISGPDGCDHVVGGSAAFIREDLRRSVPSPDASAVLVQGFQPATVAIQIGPKTKLTPASFLEQRPLLIPLRL